MNTIDKYISELLYRYECVILLGFGAFLTKRQPATIQENTNAFFPPQKLISFNSQLQNNDGLLANYVSSVENISYTDAVAKLQRYVLSLREKLAKGNRVELNKIGVFFTSVEDTLQFEPSIEVNYLTEAFGLHSFATPAIHREVKVDREVYRKEVETIEETTPIHFTPERRNERPYLKYAAVAAVVFGIGGFLGLKQVSNNTISHNNKEWKKANVEIENRIQEATFEISNPLPAINLTINKENNAEESLATNIENEASSRTFYIIAGAFRVSANARKKVQQLKSLGFNAQLIGVNKYGLHQVVYESYQNRLQALTALQDIKKNQNPKAWLFVRDNN